MKRSALPILVMASGLVPLSAQQAPAPASTARDMSVAFRFGTPGFGLEASKLLANHLGIRVGGNFFSYSVTHTETNITYDASLKLHDIALLVDFYTGARGSFHLTSGLVTNPLTISATAQPNGRTYTIHGTTYDSTQIGTLAAEARLKGVGPYLGFGFGTPANHGGGLKFLFDLGAVFGKARLTLNPTGTACQPGSQCYADVKAQEQQTQHDVDKFLKVFPMLGFGLAYRF